MLSLLSELFVGPLRTKTGERVLGIKSDGDSDFQGPTASKTRNSIRFRSWRHPFHVFSQMETGETTFRLKILFVCAF